MDTKLERKNWWENKRSTYNGGLLIAGILAFVLYVYIGTTFIMPYDPEFDITLFTTLFQGIIYLIMIFIANLFYNLGCWADEKYNTQNDVKVRNRIFNLGFWGSIALPFLIPLLLFIQYFYLREHPIPVREP